MGKSLTEGGLKVFRAKGCCRGPLPSPPGDVAGSHAPASRDGPSRASPGRLFPRSRRIRGGSLSQRREDAVRIADAICGAAVRISSATKECPVAPAPVTNANGPTAAIGASAVDRALTPETS